ncbi:MAG: GGDEF domain-containing protein [Acidiferrobacteraceae bacterium]
MIPTVAQEQPADDCLVSLMEVSCLAGRSLHIAEIMPKTLDGIAGLIPADLMTVIYRKENAVDVRGCWVRPGSTLEVDWRTLPAGAWLMEEVREPRYAVFETGARLGRELPYLKPHPLGVHALLVPLVVEDAAIGRFDILRTGAQCYFTPTEQQLAQACGKILAASMRNIMEYERVAWLAEHDPLTGIGNRRRFDAALGREVVRAERYGRNLSLLLIDLDDFKEVNTHLGLSGGDDILRRTAQTLVSGARKGIDVPCRIGGDEFAMILPEIDRHVAGELAQRLLNEVVRVTSPLWPMRFSYSISTYPNIAADLLRRTADSGLRDAKHRKERPYSQGPMQ